MKYRHTEQYAGARQAYVNDSHSTDEGPDMEDDTRRSTPKVRFGQGHAMWDELVPYGAAISHPTCDPAIAYAGNSNRSNDDQRRFSLPPTGLTTAQRDDAVRVIAERADRSGGGPAGWKPELTPDYSTRMPWLLDLQLNNTGDPFSTHSSRKDSRYCERAVLDYFAALWNNNWPNRASLPKEATEISEGNASDYYWGYVLSLGRTEANIHALYNARDYLKGRMLREIDGPPEADDEENSASDRNDCRVVYADPLPEPNNDNAYRPIIFYSADVHYSVVKAVRLLELQTFFQEGNARYPGQCPITINGEWPEQVPSHDYDRNDPLSGSVRIDDLTTLVRFFAMRGYPVIIVLNLGTTWKGAYDDVPAVNKMLLGLKEEFPWLWDRPVRYENGDSPGEIRRRNFWVHVDGAYGAAFLPFIEMAHNRGMILQKGPIFDFRNESVMSIGCSVQRWIGGPTPAGVFMTRNNFRLIPPEMTDLLHDTESTLAGSRSGLQTMLMWDFISRISYEECMQRALDAHDAAEYLESAMRDLERELRFRFGDEPDLWIARSRLALTVRFRLVNQELSNAWSLSSQRLWVPVGPSKRQARTYSHLYVRSSMTRSDIDRFVDSLRNACADDWRNAFPETDRGMPNPGAPKQPAAPAKSLPSHRIVVQHQLRP